MVDDADFEWLSQWKWYAKVDKKTVYARREARDGNGNRWTVVMHRQILGLTDPKMFGEHEDGNGLNNTRANLRPATHAENTRNVSSHTGSTSQFKGVFWNAPRGKWLAQIMVDGTLKNIGGFKNEEDAARTYNQFAKEYHGDFARYNDVFPLFPEKEWVPLVIWETNTSGFRGVIFEKGCGKWRARIRCNGKHKHLGLFEAPEDAAKKYDQAAREIFGENARLNFGL